MLFSKNVIIVGGGTGNRIGAKIPKQFLFLKEKPILMHTIKRFFEYDNNIEMILILPADYIKYWENLCLKFEFSLPHKIANGGITRFHSVKNGLDMIITEGLTAVHDAVRPFVSVKTIENCFNMAAEKTSAVPVIELTESLRVISEDKNSSCDRQSYRLVQTPQVFDTFLLKKAYEQPFNERFTDDASVVENFGENISLVNGNIENIKITTPFDLIIGETIMDYAEQ